MGRQTVIRPRRARVPASVVDVRQAATKVPDAIAPLEGLGPDEEHFHEATGNEGASFDRTYSRAALVIWPSTRILAVINQAGPKCTLPYLDDLIDQWQAAGPKKGRAIKAQAEELTGLMLQSWPGQD